VLNLLEELRGKLGLTLLLIAHNMAVVRHVCDRVTVMYLGRIVETAPVNELFTNARHPYAQGLLRAVPKLVPGRASEAAVCQSPREPIRLPSNCRFHPAVRSHRRAASGKPALTVVGLPEHVAACRFAWILSQAHVPEVGSE
jgi:peptide/nickel transport system ATP-binding protein